MARADLLLDLVKYAMSSNRPLIRKVTEAIIAEERTKQHTILAERLEGILNRAPVDTPAHNHGQANP